MEALVSAEQVWFEEATLEVDAQGVLDLLVVAGSKDGSITVRGEDRGSVEVTLDRFDAGDSKRNRAWADIDLEQGVISFKVFDKLEKSNIVIVVPRSVSLRLNAVDGNVSVEGISGEIEVNAIDGDVTLVDVSGGIVANSVDGRVRVELSPGPLMNPISLATVDGDVSLEIDRDLDANLSVSTIDGKFACNFESRLKKSGGGSRRIVGVSVSGIIGQGGLPISVNTIDGDVRIEQRD